MTFPSSKKPPFEKRTSSNDKTKVSYRKVGSKDIWNFWPESTIVKCHFYRLKKLLLRKQHHETTKPRLLLGNINSLERYLEFLTRITSKQVWKLRRLNLSYTSCNWSMHGKCYEVRLSLQLAIFYWYYPVFTIDCKLSTCNGYR